MKLNSILFFLLILFLPSQLGLHFWPQFSLLSGLRIDYLSPTIYFTDILIVPILLRWLIKIRVKQFLKYRWVLLTISIFAIANIYYSLSPILSLYKWIKVLEFSLLAIYISLNMNRLRFKDLKKAIIISSVLSSILAWWQFIRQSSIGGLLYYFGERSFSYMTPGIALFDLNGHSFLRPYATFSHPNVLAAFLLISIILVFKPRLKEVLITSFLLITIILCFSQNVWITLGLIILLFLIKKTLNITVRFIPAVCIISSMLFVLVSTSVLDRIRILDLSSLERIKLVAASGYILNKTFLVGSGLGTFILALSDLYYQKSAIFNLSNRWWLQPVHNIYLLTASEIGLLGLLFLYGILVKAASSVRYNTRLYLLLSAVMILGLNDHYFFTLQQGQLLTSIIIGLSFSSSLVE